MCGAMGSVDFVWGHTHPHPHTLRVTYSATRPTFLHHPPTPPPSKSSRRGPGVLTICVTCAESYYSYPNGAADCEEGWARATGRPWTVQTVVYSVNYKLPDRNELYAN